MGFDRGDRCASFKNQSTIVVGCDGGGQGDINESFFLAGGVGLDTNARSCIGVRVETGAPTPWVQ